MGSLIRAIGLCDETFWSLVAAVGRRGRLHFIAVDESSAPQIMFGQSGRQRHLIVLSPMIR
jgi:hypothetical protein